ncbi:DUF262 domain-containing protein [Nannocystis radixulma]|uniref:DUF262 domain-containing protein n=1 Tax=Nannocystis radixulma TaxID=2995305 RepID=A0ABT5BG88_9BACT|nr:DUF262 domain-containing protein [Nannocystis radixulma]MDC0672640.1 DUF262 domain-containing protein [Nannocystis radixulma]
MSSDTPITADRPLIPESSTAESTNVEVVMSDFEDGTLYVPEYQRDTDQWDDVTKSILIESVINNLTIPAFFFEVEMTDSGEKNAVIDGQQRITTLFQFYKKGFKLVSADEAAYISPHNIAYAGKTFDDLPAQYKSTFKKYRLTIIKLRNIQPVRLEIFRRINQGGTPLSGQDIRLAYYGQDSPSVTFVRLAGIFDKGRPASERAINGAQEKHKLEFPWDRHEQAFASWKDWWEEKSIAKGQTASEAFLWSLVSANATELDGLLKNASVLQNLKVSYHGSVDEALDAYCAQLQFQDHSELPKQIFSFEEIRDSFFPFFAQMLHLLIGIRGPSIRVTKHRLVCAIIGAAYAMGVRNVDNKGKNWDTVMGFIRDPALAAAHMDIDYPQSKGKWDGRKGYYIQMLTVRDVLKKAGITAG